MANYKTGIDLTFGGSLGTDYAIEQFYHDPLICDRKVVYIKAATNITMAHNARNVAFITSYYIPGVYNSGSFTDGETITQAVTGATAVVVGPQSTGSFLFVRTTSGSPSQTGQYTGGTSGAKFTPTNYMTEYDYGVLGTGDSYSTIRYRVDRDFQWRYHFAGGGTDNLPAYSAPFNFSGLTYDGSTAVVGTTGSNGVTLNAANAATHYWRGILDSVGDEWHTIMVADDDTANPYIVGNYEYWASDGAVHMFVVNPKTPCLSITVTGNAQFYTTPPKQYFVPRISDQTTYFAAGSGTVSITLQDINGNHVFYRIGGGSFIDAGSSSVTLTASDFASGSNTLQYYYSGNIAYTKTRIVVKDPAFPSAGETHGTTLFPPGVGWTELLAKIANGSTHASDLFATLNGGTANKLAIVENYYLTGRRHLPYEFGLTNAGISAVAGQKYGWDTIPSGYSHSYGWFAKTMLLDNITNIDTVGIEKNTAGTANSDGNRACLGTRENLIRGYYDCDALMDMVFTYDTVVAYYRSDQNANGLTAIEDFKLRDDIARMINEQIFYENLSAPGVYNKSANGSMWDVARACAALAACLVIPTYTSPCFGSCGINGTTTTYAYCPFPTDQYTWKQILIDNNQTLSAFPNYNSRFGVEEYNCQSDGNWLGKASYCEFSIMGHAILNGVNACKIAFPSKAWPNCDAWLVNNANGTLRGSVEFPIEGYFQLTQVTGYNSRFRNSAQLGITFTNGVPSGTETWSHAMNGSQVFGLLWVDEPYFNITAGRPGTSELFVA